MARPAGPNSEAQRAERESGVFFLGGGGERMFPSSPADGSTAVVSPVGFGEDSEAPVT